MKRLFLAMLRNKLFSFALLYASVSITKPPQYTIFIVVDQLAYHYLQKLRPHLTDGLKFLLDRGVVYNNAYFPHAATATATGHAAINTGTFAKDHGMIYNNWVDKHDKEISCDDDSVEKAAVFSADGFYDFGKSGQHLMVDGITDQFIMQSKPDKQNRVFAFSGKSRAAIILAGQLGKAIWYDSISKTFTSSKAYFEYLPEWLIRFNRSKKLFRLKTIRWKLRYPALSPAYNFKDTRNYKYAGRDSVIGKRVPVTVEKNPYNDPILINPLGNQIVFDVAHACFLDHYRNHKKDNLMLGIALSSLDITGHTFGPQSLEAIDLIYHLDLQIKKFIKKIYKKVKPENVLFALTADHGIEPIPELAAHAGIPARRIQMEELTNKSEEILERELGVKNMIKPALKTIQLHFDQNIFNALDTRTQKDAIRLVKDYLLSIPGIKNAWHYTELANLPCNINSIECFFKNQLYPERSGDIIIKTDPYNILTTYNDGASHRTPYEANTHVPLILYQKNKIQKKTINDKVWVLQLANTVAHVLDIPKPSASTQKLLPGVIQ